MAISMQVDELEESLLVRGLNSHQSYFVSGEVAEVIRVVEREMSLQLAPVLNLIPNPEEVFIALGAERYPIGTSRITFAIHNQSDEIIEHGAPFVIEFLDRDEWLTLPRTPDMAFTLVAYELQPRDTFIGEFSLAFHDIDFVPGTYRFRKEIDGYDVVAEFELY